jgi:chorismate mutase
MAVSAIHTPLLLCTVALLLTGLVSPSTAGLSLDTVRDFLTREEDTIVFSLIERAKYPLNRPAYDPLHFGAGIGAEPGRRHNASFAELFIRESEAVQSKVLKSTIQMTNSSPRVVFSASEVVEFSFCFSER